MWQPSWHLAETAASKVQAGDLRKLCRTAPQIRTRNVYKDLGLDRVAQRLGSEIPLRTATTVDCCKIAVPGPPTPHRSCVKGFFSRCVQELAPAGPWRPGHFGLPYFHVGMTQRNPEKGTLNVKGTQPRGHWQVILDVGIASCIADLSSSSLILLRHDNPEVDIPQ